MCLQSHLSLVPRPCQRTRMRNLVAKTKIRQQLSLSRIESNMTRARELGPGLCTLAVISVVNERDEKNYTLITWQTSVAAAMFGSAHH